MNPDVERLFTEAMELPEDERAALAAILQDSLGDGAHEEEIEAAWAAEIQRRLAAVRSGEVELIPTEEVERELEEMLEQAEEPQRAVG
jgi:putative addiction module component (TIGR02574 family)